MVLSCWFCIVSLEYSGKVICVLDIQFVSWTCPLSRRLTIAEVIEVLQGSHYEKLHSTIRKFWILKAFLALKAFFLWCQYICKRPCEYKNPEASGGLEFYSFDAFVSLAMMTVLGEAFFFFLPFNLIQFNFSIVLRNHWYILLCKFHLHILWNDLPQ